GFEELLDQQWSDLFQNTAAPFGQIRFYRPPTHRDQVVIGPVDILETAFGQHVLDQVRIRLGVEKKERVRMYLLFQLFIARMEESAVDDGHLAAMFLQYLTKTLQTSRPQIAAAPCQCKHFFFLARQVVGLAFLHHLNPVFDRTEETIGLPQLAMIIRAQQICGQKRIQGAERVALPQFRIFAGIHQLQRLDEKFYFTDAATTELEIDLPFAGPDQRGINFLLHLFHILDQVVIEIFTVDKRLQCFEQPLSQCP